MNRLIKVLEILAGAVFWMLCFYSVVISAHGLWQCWKGNR